MSLNAIHDLQICSSRYNHLYWLGTYCSKVRLLKIKSVFRIRLVLLAIGKVFPHASTLTKYKPLIKLYMLSGHNWKSGWL